MDIKHHTLCVNNINLHIAEQGIGPLVLFCHGFPETWYSWRHQLPALAEAGFRAVALDMPGYGLSDRPTSIERYSLINLTGDLVALLEALGEREGVIVGNDWGATVAWQCALLRPDRFRGVVACGVPLMGRAPVKPTRLFPQTDDDWFYTLYFQESGLAEKELAAEVRTALLKILFYASGEAGPRSGGNTPNPFGMVSKTAGWLASLPVPSSRPSWLSDRDLDVLTEAFSHGFEGGLNYYRNLDRNWEHQAAFEGLKLEVPALFVQGENDTGRVIPGMDEIIAAMPGLAPQLLDSAILPGAGHWVQQERPQDFNALLLSFLGYVQPSP